MSQNPYQFLKVDDFFSGFQQWEALAAATGHSYDPASRTVAVTFTRSDGAPCALLLTVVQRDVFRVRFSPARRQAADYPAQNTRSVVMDTLDELAEVLRASDPFGLDVSDGDGSIALVTSTPDNEPFMRVVVTDKPFGITVYGYEADDDYQIWQTTAPGIWFTPNGTDDFAIIQGVVQPTTAAYVGFGEHGGRSLVKNSEQLTFFNFDNFAYNQVYNQGPFQEREPLYHADPFFIELNGVPDRHSVCGVFVDNPAQVFMDIGYADSGQCLFGTRYADMDYYVFAGHEAADVVGRFTSMVGRSRLKPRYALGYHQGCYGYEDRGALEWAVGRYRANAIPLDGLHVDVDIQQAYQTFTINEERFPDPRGMFAPRPGPQGGPAVVGDAVPVPVR
jgi:alpha-glucosidase